METLYGAIDDGAIAVRIPKHAKKELEAYLDCGLLCRGFARLRCERCEESRLVAFSCIRTRFLPVVSGPTHVCHGGEPDRGRPARGGAPSVGVDVSVSVAAQARPGRGVVRRADPHLRRERGAVLRKARRAPRRVTSYDASIACIVQSQIRCSHPSGPTSGCCRSHFTRRQIRTSLGRQSAGTQARSRNRRQRIEGTGNRAASEGESLGAAPPGQAPTPIGDAAGPSPRAMRRKRAPRWATPEPPSAAKQAETTKIAAVSSDHSLSTGFSGGISDPVPAISRVGAVRACRSAVRGAGDDKDSPEPSGGWRTLDSISV
ncbi:transposase zinc-binding domain-containing protein [Sorangium cellulosum]